MIRKSRSFLNSIFFAVITLLQQKKNKALPNVEKKIILLFLKKSDGILKKKFIVMCVVLSWKKIIPQKLSIFLIWFPQEKYAVWWPKKKQIKLEELKCAQA